MVDEEVQEEQENVEMKAAETENGDSPDDDSGRAGKRRNESS